MESYRRSPDRDLHSLERFVLFVQELTDSLLLVADQFIIIHNHIADFRYTIRKNIQRRYNVFLDTHSPETINHKRKNRQCHDKKHEPVALHGNYMRPSIWHLGFIFKGHNIIILGIAVNRHISGYESLSSTLNP